MHPSDWILGMIHCLVCGHSYREFTDIVVCTPLITPDLSAGLCELLDEGYITLTE